MPGSPLFVQNSQPNQEHLVPFHNLWSHGPTTGSPEALAHHLADRPGFIWLDGGQDGWHILSWSPDEVLTEADDWPALARSLRGSPTEGNTPFTTGLVGYVGYGAGWATETVPKQAATPEPPVWLGRFSQSACYRRGKWTLCGPRSFRREAELLIRSSAPPPAAPPARSYTTTPQATYEQNVRRILALIGAGDCYQVNLSRQVSVDLPDPFATYQRLRRCSNAAYGGWLTLSDDLRILCNSPELLLQQDGRELLSIPIKGTRPRGQTPEADAALSDDLMQSKKDHAELAMIVDLVRNDLGKIARVGSVKAGKRTLHSHANVHHTHWPVTATLRQGIDAWDALAAVFPPGSVTGAPKVRACERINELESGPRGVYCGSLGYFDDRDQSCWNVAIRTAIWHEGCLRYHVGGGIVADSNPTSEWKETVHKGQMLALASGTAR